jgi:hypothetical protein
MAATAAGCPPPWGGRLTSSLTSEPLPGATRQPLGEHRPPNSAWVGLCWPVLWLHANRAALVSTGNSEDLPIVKER